MCIATDGQSLLRRSTHRFGLPIQTHYQPPCPPQQLFGDHTVAATDLQDTVGQTDTGPPQRS